MGISGFSSSFFKIISDGDKIVLLRDDGKTRDCYLLQDPFLKSFDISFNDYSQSGVDGFGNQYRIPRSICYTVDLTIQGMGHNGGVSMVDRPLVMGVDIFDKLSVTDYLDIINEKIKGR